MAAGLNKKRFFAALIASLIFVLIISTADAASKGNSRSEGKGKAISASKQAAAEKREAVQRSEKPQAAKAAAHSERSSASFKKSSGALPKSAGKESRQAASQPVTRSIEKAQPRIAPAPVAKGKSVEMKKQIAAQPIVKSVQTSKVVAPIVESKPVLKSETAKKVAAPVTKIKVAETKKKNIVQPVAKSIEKSKQVTDRSKIAAPIVNNKAAANKSEMPQKAAPVVNHKSAASSDKKDAKKIASPVIKPAEPATNARQIVQKTNSEDVKANDTRQKTQLADKARIAARIGQNKKGDVKEPTQIVQKKTPLKTVSSSIAANNNKQQTTVRNANRERIVRGTAGKEVAVANTGRLKSVEKAVTAIDARSSRTSVRNNTTIINNNKTVVKDFDGRGGRDYGDRRYDRNRYDKDRRGHDDGWWKRRDYHNNSNIFLSFNFVSSSCAAWSPVVYEPFYCDPIVAYEPAYVTPVSYTSASYFGYYRPIVYHRGHHYNVSYFYPGYHRRYVFMSVGGFWPDYAYTRYYWYGYHPWSWYGSEPTAYSVDGDTYNYYTYNLADTTAPLQTGSIVNGVEVPDYDGLRAAAQSNASSQMTAQLPAELAPPSETQQPAEPTESDRLFDEAVKAFGDANYPGAIEKFQRAVRLEPDDVVLPFAYAQALFADRSYEQAAAVIQTALNSMAPAKPEVFFPRGLYTDDNMLTSQIKNLEKAVMMNPSNTDLQLLYGYQLLGIGQLDQAKIPLEVAKRNARTAGPATSLLNLLEEVKQQSDK